MPELKQFCNIKKSGPQQCERLIPSYWKNLVAVGAQCKGDKIKKRKSGTLNYYKKQKGEIEINKILLKYYNYLY